jgi:tripartite ATP-independent transporter DctM subunit
MSFLSFVPCILMLMMLLLRFPVAFALLVPTCIYYAFINTTMPVEIIVQSMMSSTESFPYLAIPFFTCAGVVFNYSGISEKLYTLANLLVGHVRGGLAQVNILLSAMMGGLSGSANADAAMDAKTIVPQMIRVGYSRGFSTVVTAASSVITPIIPPGIILILYSLMADVSVARMFFAGYLPGLLIMVALMLTVAWIARIRGYVPSRERKATGREILTQCRESVWALFLPVFLLVGLRFGIFTSTEAGAVAVLYAILVGIFVYRRLKWEHFKPILMESVEATASVMFIVCSAVAFGSYLTWEGIPIAVSNMLTSNIDSPWVLLLVLNLFLLFVGFFFEGGAAMVLLAPILIPAVKALNIDLVHFGIVMSVNLTIAGFTPPVGTMMFIVLAITKTPMTEYIRECWPFLVALVGVLMLITYVPWIVLIIPNLFM